MGIIGSRPGTLADLLYSSSTSKVFVSYHHLGDQAYYEAFSSTFHDQYETVIDRSLERSINSDDDDYTRWRIRSENIKGTSVTIVLCGANTPFRKYVDWEIKATLDMEHGLIGIGLPTKELDQNGFVRVPARFQDNYASGYAIWGNWENLTQANLQAWIAQAKAKPATAIANSRELRQRNG